ncbi:MAG: ABC transporter ATP-binding protein/permease [Arenicellales bacterium]|nr:ABC transporter ATP-binding protein/permease [Arenicellales bacterium]|tara:strand:- start:1335 stop:3170 length:1836 start_codon:yes stop_codon:yes gene_type:complete
MKTEPDTAPVSPSHGENGNLWKTCALLLPFFWPVERKDLKTRVVVAVVSLVLAKLANLTVPLVLGWAVDTLSNLEGQMDLLFGIPIAALAAYGLARLSYIVFNEIRDAVFSKVSQHAVRQVAIKVFNHLHALSIRFHLERKTGALNRFIDRGTTGIQFLLSFVAFNILPTLFEVLLVCGILWYLYGISYALVTAVTIGIYVWLTFGITAWRIRIRRKMNDAENEASTRQVDSLLNFETVRYFNNESHELTRVDEALKTYEQAAVKSRESLSLLNVSQAAVVISGITIMLIMAALNIRNGTMTVGGFVVVNTYLMQLSIPLNFLGTVYREIRQALVDMENMFTLLEEVPEIKDLPGAQPLSSPRGDIRFTDVHFGYDAQRVILHGISFQVKAGEKVAIVGPTGAGKSTISRLLLRFYDPDSGRIAVDGLDLQEITQASLRDAIGVVPQDTVLFNDTIYYNIAYGDPSADEQHIYEAARTARIHDFISQLPSGYQTRVGERGLKLSGGEKQRVAIARAVLKNPTVFFFDEATSSLDSATESDIQTNLDDISSGRSTLIIAHRLSTVVSADRILVLDDGRIIEHGTHQQLLAEGGLYADLWQEQEKERESRQPV